MKTPYYITTPIYYPSNKLHIGNTYTTVAADTIARYKKLRGFDVRFLTGTDEHGQKIELAAKEKGVEPIVFVNEIVAWIKDLWKTMDIDYDYYIRTTDDYHIETVKKIFKKLYDKGDIYKGDYEGKYCTPCETFFTDTQLVNGNCPDCGRPVHVVKEEAYFFKMSNYTDKIIKHIEDNPEFILPESRKNEMLNNFLKKGLDDLCVSRTTFTWGIPVEFDKGHIVYVWIDALSNYISYLGYLSDDDEDYKKYWPADVHLVGKDIIRFHTIIWPAILMALNEPLPKQIFGHGFLVINGEKMSKSKGNVVDPNILVEKYGVDAIRYYLMRDIVFGQDGNFSNEALIQRINSDLANDLGNLLSRTVGMIDKYFDKALPTKQIGNEFDKTIIDLAIETVSKVEEHMDKLQINDALDKTWALVRRCNKYVDETEPWILAKDDTKKAELANIMYTLSEVLRILAVLISPVMPNTPAHIYSQLNITDDNLKTWESIKTFGLLPKEITITKAEVVFPRIDIKKEMEEIEKLALENKLKAEKEFAKENKDKKDTKSNEKAEKNAGLITIDDFAKVNLKVGVIIECEPVEGSDKLLKSQIRLGDEVRQIVSGIAHKYKKEEMIGKKVIVVTNLKPVKLRGVLSEGMILAASINDDLSIVTVDNDIVDGAVVR